MEQTLGQGDNFLTMEKNKQTNGTNTWARWQFKKEKTNKRIVQSTTNTLAKLKYLTTLVNKSSQSKSLDNSIYRKSYEKSTCTKIHLLSQLYPTLLPCVHSTPVPSRFPLPCSTYSIQVISWSCMGTAGSLATGRSNNRLAKFLKREKEKRGKSSLSRHVATLHIR